ncbi:hypothetical protein GYB22_02075 [bacterium]|nr:hypothetical protein [bacterium]
MNSTIVVIVVLVLVFLVFSAAIKGLIKLLATLALIAVGLGFLYYKAWWPFKDTSLTLNYMTNQYCEEIDDEDICECVIDKIKADIEERFTAKEIDEVLQDRAKGIYVMRKSMSATEKEAKACLEQRGVEEKYEKFLEDVNPLRHDFFDLLSSGADSLKMKAEEAFDQIKVEKENIDERY